jgi:ABC-type multidrug transport system ATPase subunit
LQELSEIVDKGIFLKKGKILEFSTIEDIKSKIQPEIINIRLKSPMTAKQIEEMRSLGSIQEIQANGTNLRLHFSGGPDTIYDILKKAIAIDLEVISFTPEILNLESYYIKIMGDLEVS